MSGADEQPTPSDQPDVGEALNKGLTSAWGWFSKATDVVKEKGTKLAAELPGKMDKALESLKAMEDKPEDKQKVPTTCPWDEVPSGWAAGDWEAFSKAVIADEGTYLLGPDRGMTQDEVRTLRKHGVTVDFSIENDDVYTSRVCKEMLDYEPLGDMRFEMVPRYMKEEVFWRNMFWKLRELGKVEGAVYLKPVLLVLNAQRGDIPEDWKGTDLKRSLPERFTNIEARGEKIDEVLRSLDKKKPEEGVEKIKKQDIYEEGKEALMLLKECLDDIDMVEHLKVACDTCINCREKLQKEIEEHGGEGDSFTETLTLIGELDNAIKAYEAKVSRPIPAAPVTTSSADDDKCSSNMDSYVEVPSNPQGVEEKASEVEEAGKQPTAPSTESSPKADQTDFTALPWDSDESDD